MQKNPRDIAQRDINAAERDAENDDENADGKGDYDFSFQNYKFPDTKFQPFLAARK